MSTNLTYNGVTLGNVLTRSFKQEAVYDDSRTDLLYHKFTIHVTAYVSRIDNSATVRVSPQAGDTAVDTQKYIRSLLMEPRGDFRFSVGGKTLLEATKANDFNNGPKPQRCDISKITGSQLFWVDFEIEVCTPECKSSANATGVLSNRWSMDDSVDGDWFTKRTIRGRLRVARNDLNPQAFRGWVVPPLQDGFKRASMHFVTTPDGLNLDYEIADQQLYAAPPIPATTWEATHTESTGDGVSVFGEINIRLTGPPKVDKRVLIQAAAQIAQQKLGVTRGGFLQTRYVIESAAIIDQMDKPEISFRVRIQRIGSGEYFWGNIGEEIGKTLTGSLQVENYNQYKHPVPTQLDLASPTGLFVCYLQSPCNDVHAVPQAYDATTTGMTAYRSPDTTITHSTGSLPPDPYQRYSSEHAKAIYTHYQIRNQYINRGHKIQLPIAGADADGQDSCVNVQLGRRTSQRHVFVEATRIGDWPTFPTFADYFDASLGDATLLDSEFEDQAPELSADGSTRIFRIRAVYKYSLKRAPKDGEYRSSPLPWMVPTQADITIPADRAVPYRL